MRKYNKILVFVFLSFFIDSAISQNIYDELVKIPASYLKAENFSADVEAISYASKNDSKGTVMGIGSIHKSMKLYYSKFGTDEFMNNNECSIIVDYAEKTVSYYTKSDTEKVLNPITEIDYRKIFRASDSIAYNGIKGDLVMFSVFSKDSPIYKIDFVVNKLTYFVTELDYYYENTEEDNYEIYKMCVKYNNISTQKVDKSYFSEKNYVAYQNGKMILAPKYNGFTLETNTYSYDELQ
jgi:hypothetical protein